MGRGWKKKKTKPNAEAVVGKASADAGTGTRRCRGMQWNDTGRGSMRMGFAGRRAVSPTVGASDAVVSSVRAGMK